LGIAGAELAAVGEEEAVGGAGAEGAANVEPRIRPEEDAVGVEEEEIGAAGDPQGAEEVGGVVAGDAAEDGLDGGRVGKVGSASGIDVEVLEAVEEAGAAQGTALDLIGEGVERDDAGAFGAEGVVGDYLGEGWGGVEEQEGEGRQKAEGRGQKQEGREGTEGAEEAEGREQRAEGRASGRGRGRQYCSVKDSGFNYFTKNRPVGTRQCRVPTREINSRF